MGGARAVLGPRRRDPPILPFLRPPHAGGRPPDERTPGAECLHRDR